MFLLELMYSGNKNTSYSCFWCWIIDLALICEARKSVLRRCIILQHINGTSHYVTMNVNAADILSTKITKDLPKFTIGLQTSVIFIQYSSQTIYVKLACFVSSLTLPILRLLSSKDWGYFPPKYRSAKIFENHLNPVMLVSIGWLSLQYSKMSTHVPGFQLYFRFFASFCIGQISQQQHKR